MSQEVMTTVGKSFTIGLPRQSNGAIWALSLQVPDHRICYMYTMCDTSGVLGSLGGTAVDQFTFEATETGDTQLMFSLVRPWNGTTFAHRTYLVRCVPTE
jgi:hypothetical protein